MRLLCTALLALGFLVSGCDSYGSDYGDDDGGSYGTTGSPDGGDPYGEGEPSPDRGDDPYGENGN